MSTLSTKQVVDFIENRRLKCDSILKTLLVGDHVIYYQELSALNIRLTEILMTTFIRGEKLVQDGIVETVGELLDLKRRPSSNEEAFREMKNLILKGSENLSIRNFAIEMAEKGSSSRGYAVSVPIVSQLYQSDQTNRDYAKHCQQIVEDIFQYVQTKATYVSDPPDDYYQRAEYTHLLNFKGDCDDFAILIAATLRSIGYRTYLAFQQGHVLSGVVLRHSSTELASLDSDSFGPDQLVEVPLDPFMRGFELEMRGKKMLISVFDLASGNFLTNLFETVRLYGLSEDDILSIKKQRDDILDKLVSIGGAETYYVDSPIPSIKLADVFRSESAMALKHFLNSMEDQRDAQGTT